MIFLLYLAFELYIDLGTLQQRRIQDVKEETFYSDFDGHATATVVISKESRKAYCIIHARLGFPTKIVANHNVRYCLENSLFYCNKS